MSRQRLEARKPGIYRVHQRGCEPEGKCKCPPSYQARVYVTAQGRSATKHFSALREAQIWQAEAKGAVRVGKLRAGTKRTVEQAAEELLAGMRDGSITSRSGKPYKPATIRSYDRALRLRILPAFGRMKLSDVQAGRVQRFVEGLTREGLDPSTVRNTLDPLRVVFRRAVRLGEAAVDPTDLLDLPALSKRRRTVSLSPTDAQAMLDALPEGERALWAVAFFAGLRRGELRALRWSDVDLAGQPPAIAVSRTWDDNEGERDDTKTEAGTRSVALPNIVVRHLADHGLATGRAGADLVFGRTADLPFVPSTIRRRALKAWEDSYVCTHQARHAAASFLIACPDVSDLELMETIGHSDIRTTKNIYGHRLPGSHSRVAAAMDALLAGSGGQ